MFGYLLFYSHELPWLQTAAEDDRAVGAIPQLSDGGVSVHYARPSISSLKAGNNLEEKQMCLLLTAECNPIFLYAVAIAED